MANLTSDTLYHQLRQDILEQNIAHGSVLKQEELSTRYGVSRIPIRDVLQRLKSEGWLIPSGKCGVMVNPLTAAEAEDLYLMRMRLEPLLLGYAIPHISNKRLGEAIDILEQLTSKDLNAQQHGELNWQFHTCLCQAANRPTLQNTIHNLHQLCSRYIGFHAMQLDYVDTAHNEHIALIAAIKEKQIEAAQAILTEHIQKAGQILVSYLSNQAVKS
ncbi:GntR family transcriptional regulator [Paraglaciecola aquimarina]|uniref:GntR family transcriptional regulator n=1 Tax=Paraglaciecola aquimarina TaxID=1235557 RepID=A0ABU3SWS2_9ALTE|nr:GntR family transcriptional regulator [Paraglaciecola aquimarina]MDU0354463.1 GntR family transcriptional regulator [Paraglaciecola aquimarina]